MNYSVITSVIKTDFISCRVRINKKKNVSVGVDVNISVYGVCKYELNVRCAVHDINV